MLWLFRSLKVASLLVRAAALLLVLETAALAQEDRFVLSWSAPPSCPSESEVTKAVLKSIAARTSGTPSWPALVAHAEVSERTNASAPPTWHVRLKTQRGETRGQREIEAESCAALAQATAVVLSLALLELKEDAEVNSARPPEEGPPPSDADFSGARAKSEGSPNPKDARAPGDASQTVTERKQNSKQKKRREQKPPPVPPASEPASTNRKDTLARFSLSARSGLNTGTLPRAALGGGVSFAWLPGPVRLELDAQMWGKQSKSIENTPSGADLFLRDLGARACLIVANSPRLALSPCLGAKLHLLRAEGFGSDSNYDARASWPALTGGLLGLAHLTSRFALRADVEGYIPLARPRFFVERVATVHRIPPGAVATLLGVEVRFP